MINILIAASVSFLLVLVGTPMAIRVLRRQGIGQFVREDGPKAHFVKKGTPTMGGVVIISGAVVGYLAAHLRPSGISKFSTSGLLAVSTIVAMAILGFADDYLKNSKKRSLGLSKTAKFLGQALIAVGFVAAVPHTQAAAEISFVRPLGVGLGIFFALWIFLIIAAAANGANLADGLDGLACGSGAMVMGAYVIIAFWQVRHLCGVPGAGPACYDARASGDLALVAASMLGATAAFLWWNAAPAKIFMGDTGSLALGGAMAALAILTNTQLLLIVLGGLYVVEVASVVLQVISFRIFGQRLFLMAPIHHHFELLGWPEFTVIVRFWVLAALAVAFGLGLFYGEFLNLGGGGSG